MQIGSNLTVYPRRIRRDKPGGSSNRYMRRRNALVEEQSAEDGVIPRQQGEAHLHMPADAPTQIRTVGKRRHRSAVEDGGGRGVDDVEALRAETVIPVEGVQRQLVRLAI